MNKPLALTAWMLCTLCGSCGNNDKDVAASGAKATDTVNGSIAGSGTTSKSGTASTSGSVQGYTLTPKWAVFAAGVNTKNSIYVLLSSQDSYCPNVTQGITSPNHISIVLSLSTVAADATTPVPSPGTYPIVSRASSGSGNFSLGVFNVTDAHCDSVLSSSQTAATGGSVIITEVSSMSVAGTFTMKVGSETVTGSFDSVPCAGLVAQAQSGATLSCQDS